MPDPRFEYVEELHGLATGQRRRSRIGSVYEILAIERSGFVICRRGQRTVRIWCDNLLGWQLA